MFKYLCFTYFQCDAGKGARVLYDLLYGNTQKVLLLAGCSTVCTTVAEGANLWNLVTLCYGASSPALSNRYVYTIFNIQGKEKYEYQYKLIRSID